ncbi:Multifunctional tryptophan biosynthesis protein [Neolecta irregularis DAH-3]|uniref:Multifunctional tryptophan biosynthesis protein n=1 Tax=Neolecta irregularis (strain DAH-3) TaxID=1198029 RepID=A0A1U7LKM8_NEOID|nr:Multifunctional tryptophan biosynthesis protein [Neolecta irregularis DAH-3]|eukprot:OLL23199.1 Multifunctional tryptophan biosynthesis protein [Neolecta irregularis DAH-3]
MSKPKVVLIDNYDSFSYNVVQYLSNLGADVTVYRNDVVTLEQLTAQAWDKLVISPGPGHPETDGGISREAIQYYAGKIPVLGVCMGEQCIFTAFGGKVDFAGEIVHGKTSLITHDGKGIYHNVPQDIAVTRYHSLAGTHSTLPDILEVTSRTESGVIMGVRHKEFTVEGVQYHPESILSEHGKLIIKNFLELSAGTWEEEELIKKTWATKIGGSGTILDQIHKQKLLDIAEAKATPGLSPKDLQTNLSLSLVHPLIDFAARLRMVKPALMAEIKRASPSKGNISIDASAPILALEYAVAGASVISVLTEPRWFKGTLADLAAVRQALGNSLDRPAILRKDFIIDRYQVMEARLFGADSLLLIVSMLNDTQLCDLYEYSKTLGMEPLVEVNSADEMTRAIKIGAKVIGVNNRDLHSFTVDMSVTSRLADMVPEGTILCALSGISTHEQVEKYVREGIHAILVGEALMRSCDKKLFIDTLLGRTNQFTKNKPIVKICGIRSPEAAVAAAEAGADLLGLIFARDRRRSVTIENACEIIRAVRSMCRINRNRIPINHGDWFDHYFDVIKRNPHRPSIVGVFQDHTYDDIFRISKILRLDAIQLHGNEPVEWARLFCVPVIKVFSINDPQAGIKGYHAVTLIDSGRGGTGERVDLAQVAKLKHSVMIAGGITLDNVEEVLKCPNVRGVDTAGGVEDEHGNQDIDKIRKFVEAVDNVV